MNQGQYTGGSGDPNYLQPLTNYDPRRLFPFGLSPIPEVPSELASEVSSIASYSPTPSLDDSDTEIESVRSRCSIMYSGSCDSVKSNLTLNRKSSSSESESETEHDDSSYEETDDEAEEIESLPPDRQTPVKPVELVTIKPTIVREVVETIHKEECKDVNQEETHQLNFCSDVVSGAATASEIFRHLQATRGKQEVTTELAKILNVLKTTLNEEKEESSSDDEQNVPGDKSFGTIPTGKPPKPPSTIKFSKHSVISPDIQARIKDLEQNKHGNPKEEMTLLSKILVTLLCSCKTTAAAQELKRILRQFKEVAKVAMEEGDDTLESLRSSSRASSRSSKRRARSRTASGNSNISGNSETDSMNTLTPGDSKSSGTDDETGQDPNKGKLRFTSNVNVEKGQHNMQSCVSYTLTLPLKRSDEEEEEQEDENEEEYDDDEWEWEYEDDEEQEEIEKVTNKSQNNSSGSSRNLTPSDASSGTTRKILNDMELGAYNTNSDPSHSNSQSTPITEEEDGLIDDEEVDQVSSTPHTKRRVAEKSDNSEHLFCHLEETFKVLSDTYKIITTGSTPEAKEINIQPTIHINQDPCNTSFEDILDDVSTQCVQLETEMMKSSRQSTATPEPRPRSKAQSRPQSRSNSRATATTSRPNSQAANVVNSRPSSKASSRPVSRAKVKTPVLPEAKPEEEEEEEDWGDEDEWEYYYEEDYPEGDEGFEESNQVVVNQAEPVFGSSRPTSRVLHRSRPASRQEIDKFIQSRPQSQQKINKEESRPSSRIVMRPASRNAMSRAASRCSVVNTVQEEEEEDEWEYYYEEEYPEETTTKAPSRPSSRHIMRSRPASKQEIIEYKSTRPSSRESLKQEPISTIVKRPASTLSLPASRAVSRCSTVKNDEEEEEEDWGDEDEWEYYYEEEYPDYASEETQQQKPVSRPASRQKQPSRPTSRAKSQIEVKPVSRPASVNKKNKPTQQDEEWEYFYEDDEKKSQPTLRDNCPPVIKVDNGLKLVSRPNSRNSASNSRPVSVQSSRPVSRSGSRPGSRTASRLKMTSALGNVDEEEEYEWYDDDDDPELARFSPTLTTAPTTRATSPFPDEKGNVNVEDNQGTGFSRRKMSAIHESEESTPVPGSKTPLSRMSTATPNHDRRTVMSKTPTAMTSMTGVSVCLAAEYLGQDADQLAASLPINFIEDSQSSEKKKKLKSKSKDKSSDTGEEDRETRKKKKKSKRFLPKVGVKELANKLEPHLFQDGAGKMVMSQDEVSGAIYENKKKSQRKEADEKSQPRSPIHSQSEERRRSVKDLVELISTTQAVSQSSSPPNSGIIPSISASSQMVMPPPPPHPYYANQNQQYMGPQYQPYPMDVHGPYSQYPPQSPHSPYQPYPPQSPYQQYPPQQYYQGYQPPPPPPLPQHYQQYPQQYPQYHHQQMPSYPAYQQGYPPPPQQPIVYHSDNNPNQMRVVSGGQTTVVNMRSNRSTSRQREASLPAKGSESQRRSPNDSEAYGTGSTGSDQTESQEAGMDHEESKEGEDGKPPKRHSRLFKLLQDSDYTDSSDGAESRSSEYSSRISMKNMEDKPESDIDSVCSGLEKSSGIERKHSFRSHKSSNKESDNDSIHSGGVERKISPSSIHSLKQKRYMQLNLQSNFDPSSSEVSTPNSPTVPFSDWRRSQSKPPSRTFQYHAEDFDSHAGVSDDSSYQSLQSLNSFDSVYDANAGREVEEIMKRKVNRDSLYRYQTDSPSSYVRASPKNLDLVRASPKVSSSSPKSDGNPKLEQELLELSNFPSSPGISLRQLQSHRSFYGNK